MLVAWTAFLPESGVLDPLGLNLWTLARLTNKLFRRITYTTQRARHYSFLLWAVSIALKQKEGDLRSNLCSIEKAFVVAMVQILQWTRENKAGNLFSSLSSTVSKVADFFAKKNTSVSNDTLEEVFSFYPASISGDTMLRGVISELVGDFQ